SPAYRLDLQRQILKAHRVVAAHRAFKLQRKDPFQISLPTHREGTSRLRRCHPEPHVERSDVLFLQKSVRRLHRRDCPQAQLLRQPPLPSPEITLAASSRLGPVGWNHPHSQLSHRPSYLLSHARGLPSGPPWASAKNGCPGRYTRRRTIPAARS